VSSALSSFDFGVAGVERSEPPVRRRWGLVSLDPSHPTPILLLDKALGNDSSNVRTGGQAAYKERPTWLDLAHRKLDEAVFAAYGWAPSLSDDALLARLLDLNLQRAGSPEGA